MINDQKSDIGDKQIASVLMFIRVRIVNPILWKTYDKLDIATLLMKIIFIYSPCQKNHLLEQQQHNQWRNIIKTTLKC